MRKIYLPLLALLALDASAAKLSPEESLARVLGMERQRSSATLSAGRFALAWSSENENVYCFNNSQGGFLITAGDDMMGASLLGYSDTGRIDPANLPPALMDMLEAFSTGYFESAPTRSAKSALPPILKSTWTQDLPYNNDCPQGPDGTRAYTGCAATAIAQVLNHFKYPDCGTGEGTATMGDTALRLDLSQYPIDWANILDDYSGNYSPTEAAAVANLMHVTGMAINMEYGLSASAASVGDCVFGLTRHLKFDKSLRSLRRDFFTVSEWNNLVYEELAKDSPVVYFGFNGYGGHAFVIDGYDGEAGDYFHVNWGWGGMSDGYFLLTNLSPTQQGIGGSADGYNKNQEAFFDMVPDHGTEFYQPVIGLYGSFGVKNASLLKSKNPVFCAATPGVNNYQGFYNVGVETTKGNLGVRMVNNETGETTYAAASKVSSISVFGREQSFEIEAGAMPGEGEYTVTPAFLYEGIWQDIPQDATARVRLTLTVTDKRFKFSSQAEAVVLTVSGVSIDPQKDIINGEAVRLSATVSVEGGTFGGNLIPVLCTMDNTIVTHLSPRNVLLESGESAVLEWDEPFESSIAEGHYNFYIVKEDGFKIIFGPLEMNVKDPSSVDLIHLSQDDVEIYNMSGIRVTNPVKGGIYIMRCGTSFVKVRL